MATVEMDAECAVYRDALDDAIRDWRTATAALVEKEGAVVDAATLVRRLRALILALSNQIGVEPPPDVVASLDRRGVDARKFFRKAKS